LRALIGDGRYFYGVKYCRWCICFNDYLTFSCNEGISGAFVGDFEDNKVSQILQLPKHAKPVGIICLGYPAMTPERLSRIDISKLVHFEKW